MITISDVARHCGVSESTVSRVMNGNSKISRPTKDKVNAAIEELGYKPLRKHRKKITAHNVTLVIPNTSLYTLGSTLKEMALTLEKSDMEIRIANLHRNRVITPDIARELCRKDTDGLILYGCNVPEEAAAVFYEENIPVVVQQGYTSHLVSFCVNNYNGMRDGVSYVVSRGYRKIAYVSWTPDDFNTKARISSFRNVMDEAGLDSSLTAFGDLNREGGYEATRQLIENESVEAIVFASDILAYGGIKYLNSRGIHYPRDIGLMGFDDAYPSDVLELTSMYQLLDENAHLVMESLLEMIKNKKVSPAKEVLLTPKLVIRNSLK